MNPLEIRLREAETRSHIAENILDAAAVLSDADVPGGSPQAHRLFHEIVSLSDRHSMRSHLEAQGVRPLREAESPSALDASVARGTYTTAARKLLAEQGNARPDGSYPITRATDVEHAVDDFNRAGGTPEDKAHIIEQAKAVAGGTDKLPADWSGSTRLQESSQGLRQLGIPTLDGGAPAPAHFREAASAADLARFGIPIIDESCPAQQRQGSTGSVLDGIPMLPEPPGTAALRPARFTESERGTVICRIA